MGQSIKLQDNSFWDISSIRVVKNILTKGDDVNNYFYNGCYFFDSEHTPINIPFGNGDGWLIVLSEQPLNEGRYSGYIKQIWLRGGTAGANDHETYIRTGNLTVMNYGPWQRLIAEKDIFYKDSDVYKNISTLYCGGYIVNSNKMICANITLPKRLDNVEVITPMGYDISVCSTSDVGNFTLDPNNSYMSVGKADGHNVQLTIQKSSSLSVTKDTPISIAIRDISLLFNHYD